MKNRLHVEVVKFMGKFGAFAAREQVMYRCDLVGVNGKRRDGGSWQSEGMGNPDPKYARADARGWAKFLGCEVKEVSNKGAVMKIRDDYFASIKSEDQEVNVAGDGEGQRMLLQTGPAANYTCVYLTDSQARKLASNILAYLKCKK
jgi:hypothetical protein